MQLQAAFPHFLGFAMILLCRFARMIKAISAHEFDAGLWGKGSTGCQVGKAGSTAQSCHHTTWSRMSSRGSAEPQLFDIFVPRHETDAQANSPIWQAVERRPLAVGIRPPP